MADRGEKLQNRHKIALALQGGSSHGAFTWVCSTDCCRSRI
jgi:hypothetical protein